MALCPMCQHVLPEEPVRHCPNCGASVEAAPTPLPASPPPVPPFVPPAAGWGEPPRSGQEGHTWEDRHRIGLLTALVETTKDVLLQPTSFFRAMPRQGGMGSPLLYAVLIGWAGLVAAAFYQALFHSLVGPGALPFGDRPELTAMVGWVEGWGGFVAQVVFGGVFVAISTFVAAGILHLFLLLLGGAREGFEATFRVVSFAQATSILFLVPFCGQLIGFVWAIVLYVIGLAEAHRIGYGRSAAATLLPLVLLCCCCAGFVFMFASALAGIAGTAVQ
jgi:hypothetical protein